MRARVCVRVCVRALVLSAALHSAPPTRAVKRERAPSSLRITMEAVFMPGTTRSQTPPTAVRHQQHPSLKEYWGGEITDPIRLLSPYTSYPGVTHSRHLQSLLCTIVQKPPCYSTETFDRQREPEPRRRDLFFRGLYLEKTRPPLFLIGPSPLSLIILWIMDSTNALLELG